MNRIAVAQELVRIAEMLTAMPMMRVDLGVELRPWITPILRSQMGLEGNAARANPVKSWVLTCTTGVHNKFHYFAIYRDQNGDYVGGNAWGRIGYSAKAIVVAISPDYHQVEQKIMQKMLSKTGNNRPEDNRYILDRFAA